MITIGCFTQAADGAFAGAIRTLTLNAKAVQFRPVDRATPKAPDFRVFAGDVELGAAWKKTSQAQRDYVSVRLDDPSFPEPVRAVLVKTDEGYRLIWSRWAQA